MEAAGFGLHMSPFWEDDVTRRPMGERVVIDGAEREVVGRPAVFGWDGVEVLLLQLIEPGYREALGLPLLSGRDVTAADGPSGEDVALVNEAMARRYWPGRSPIGAHLQLKFPLGTLVRAEGQPA